MVADARAPLGATVAPELEARLRGDELRELLIGLLHKHAVVVARNAVDVLVVDEAAALDLAGGATDELSILENIGAFGKRFEGDFVARWDVPCRGEREQGIVIAIDDLRSIRFLMRDARVSDGFTVSSGLFKI